MSRPPHLSTDPMDHPAIPALLARADRIRVDGWEQVGIDGRRVLWVARDVWWRAAADGMAQPALLYWVRQTTSTRGYRHESAIVDLANPSGWDAALAGCEARMRAPLGFDANGSPVEP